MRICSVFGLLLNLNAGKSECVPILKGPGRNAFDVALQNSDNYINCDLHGVQPSILCSKQYKHMGTKFSARLGMTHEVATRSNSIISVICSFPKALRNKYISTHIKICIVKMYLLTAATFQCSTWANLSKFQSAVFACL